MMTVTPVGTQGISLALIEGALTLIVVAIAFCFPGLGSGWFDRIEQAFAALARKRMLSVVLVGISALLLRLALLPVCPIPHPFVQDDFSFLLAGDTFASGRLTNPTPAMWQHFESMQISMRPTYMSMYFPAQGLIFAAGKVLFGNAWFGLLLITALMCSAITWALQAWLPPRWALLGGFVSVLRIGAFSYWINTYSGGGSVAALAGALVLGALPRFLLSPRLRYAFLMGTGFAVLAISRPFEGILLSVPVAVWLWRWAISHRGQFGARFLLPRIACALALVAISVAWMAHYDRRLFGNPLTPPYQVQRATYAVVPYWVWQQPRKSPLYRHAAMREFYAHQELGYFRHVRTVPGFISETFAYKPLRILLFYGGFILFPPLIMWRRVALDRRVRFLVVCLFVLATGMVGETFLIPHYVAPFTAGFYALGLQAMRHLRVWKPSGQPVGRSLVRLCLSCCVILFLVRICANPLHVTVGTWPSFNWGSEWYGPGNFGQERAKLASMLEQQPGSQLAIVRYSPHHSSLDEWVYNGPDIDHSKVIWAREMDPANDAEVIRYYKDRTVWLVQPDLPTPSLTPYPLANLEAKASLR